MNEKIKIVFFGTPEFAANYLQSLLSDSDFDIIGVVTQPDKPAGRNQEIIFSPVKQIAKEKEIKVFQPEILKNNLEIIDQLKNIKPDLFVVVAYGSIIPQEILDIPKFGVINVHPSLLPKYRGASPIQSALLAGEKKTGVTIMLIDAKMDHGSILTQKEIELTGEETNDYLHKKIADTAADLLGKTVKDYLSGKIKPQEQDHSLATFCKVIDKSQAQINWSDSAQEIKQKIYAFYPWPGTWTMWNPPTPKGYPPRLSEAGVEAGSKRIKLFPPVEILKTKNTSFAKATGVKPGEAFLSGKNLAIICGQNALIIHKLQIEGKKEMLAEEFIRGYVKFIGSVLD
ncbi:MAG: methionyl-tRNA formyltransferase [Patescibacteria group bacterium]|jgi:methionyl-tRNA formyltransferase